MKARPIIFNGEMVRAILSVLWNSLNEKRGDGWDENPWVWCISFKRSTEGDR